MKDFRVIKVLEILQILRNDLIQLLHDFKSLILLKLGRNGE